jgi:multiple sugar transport system substrate-binding protein
VVGSRRIVRLVGGLCAALLVGASVGCGGGDESSVPTLTWYINPDNGGQADLARSCTEAAGGRYRIETSLLPNDADGQREQLVRRLAADDSSIDLMSLDVVYVPEFAQARFLRPFADDVATELTDGVMDAPVATATWNDRLYAAPFYANTQLLWYRQSVAERAGLDLEGGTVTWDQLVAAGEQTRTTVQVTGRRYEGYMVWINALVTSAGGEILRDVEAGRDAVPQLDSDAGRTAAGIVRQLARSSAADPGLDVATEEEARAGFQADDGGFLALWPYVYNAAKTAVDDGSLDQAVFDDIRWARYPQAVAGTDSAPPLGGINLAVGAFTRHPRDAVDAVRCLTTVESQTSYFLAEGNPASRSAVYDDADVRAAYPFADLIRESIGAAGVRPRTPFYTDVSAAVLRDFSPPRDVRPDSTPAAADSFVSAVLADRKLV